MSAAFKTPDNFHSYYAAKTAALYKAMGDDAFAPDLDALARALVFALWRCHSIDEEHVCAANALYSKGQPKPTYLLWELVSECSKPSRIAVPDFFRVLALMDRALNKHVCRDITDFLRELLLRLCGSQYISSETEFINSAVSLLLAAAECENIMEFHDTISAAESAASEPVTLLCETEGNVDFKPISAKDISAVKLESEAKVSENAEDVDSLLSELDSLIGMEQIKKDVRSLINLIKVRKLREENGLAVPALSLHMVFTGNPGTGKTTVARLLSRLYLAIGVLQKGTLVEVDRSGLVAGYVGQTAIKTQEAIEKAAGGILFIDEAYSLAPAGGGSDFGQEAIETILKAMEDRRDELVVIAAGYPEPMERFISSNPGLESRFGKYFHFDDYNGGELFEIFRSICEKNQYTPDDAAIKYAQKLFAELYEARDENFGNARDVRNIFEKAVARQSDRVAGMESPSRDDLLTITEADLQAE